eukprot:COSAG02_NODE_206_length_29144_cov_12.855121_14_plen_188_part_00
MRSIARQRTPRRGRLRGARARDGRRMRRTRIPRSVRRRPDEAADADRRVHAGAASPVAVHSCGYSTRYARSAERRGRASISMARARGRQPGDFDFLSQAPEMSQMIPRTRARGGSRFWSLDHWRSRAFDTLRQLFHTIFRCCTAFLLASPARNSQSPKFSVALTKSVVFRTVLPVENHGENKEPTPI